MMAAHDDGGGGLRGQPRDVVGVHRHGPRGEAECAGLTGDPLGDVLHS